MSNEIRFKLKTSVQTSISNASKLFPEEKIAIRSKAVSLLYAVAFGCRDIKPSTVAMGKELTDTSFIDSITLRRIASDVGEVLFYNHTDVLEIANRIYDLRYQMLVNPEMVIDSMSIKDYIESKVPGASTYVIANLPRVLETVNCYFEEV